MCSGSVEKTAVGPLGGVTGMKGRRAIILGFLVCGLAILWFVGVDRSWFIEGCEDCLFHRDIVQYRIFGIPIHERSDERNSLIQLVARDLGAPCAHRGFYRLHKHRWWGLCYLGWPKIDGTFALGSTEESWYNEDVADKLKAVALVNPTLGEEFRRRVLYRHDWNYWRCFGRELREETLGACPSN